VATEVFANDPSGIVTSGGTDVPAAGTQETWALAACASFPAASSTASPPTQFHIADFAAPAELITVSNTSGATWTVTRGAEGTVPVAHVPPFTVVQVTTAGFLGAVALATAGGGTVTSVTAGDTSIVVGGTGTAPTIETGTLDVIAADHPPAANWSNNSRKITSLANGSAAQDAAAFGQIPSSSSPLALTAGGTGVSETTGAALLGALGAASLLTRAAVLTASGNAAAGTIVPVSTAGGAVTVTLPGAPAGGTVVAVKCVIFGAGNNVTIACAGTDVLNKAGGGTSLTLQAANQGVYLCYDLGTGIWTDLADDLPLSYLQALFAPLASPALTGTPTAPTAAALTSTTQVATTAFTTAAVAVETTRAEAAEALLALKPFVLVSASGDTTGATDYAAIAAAIASLPASGGMAWLAPGTFWINASITIPANILIAGTGEYITTVKLAAGALAVNPFLILNVSSAGIRDLAVDVSSSTTAYGIYVSATSASMTGIEIRRVRVINGGAYGLAAIAAPTFLSGGTTYTIGIIAEDVNCSGAAGTGIYVWGGKSVRLVRPIASGTGSCGILIWTSTDVHVIAGEADGNVVHGLCFNNWCSDFIVTGGRYVSNSQYGLVISSACTDFTVTGPLCNYNLVSGMGVDVLVTSYAAGAGTASAIGTTTTLTDTTKNWATNLFAGWTMNITGGTGSGQSAVIASNTATTLTFAAITTAPDTTSVYAVNAAHIIFPVSGTIAGAVSSYNTTNGIWVDYCSGLTISGCEVHHNQRGVDIVAQYCTVTGNDIHDNTSFGVTLYQGTTATYSATGGHRVTGNSYRNNNSGGTNVYNPANNYPNIVDEYVNLGQTVTLITATNSAWPVPNGANWLEITAAGGGGQGGGGAAAGSSTLTTGLTSGNAVTALAFAALPIAISSGQSVTVISGSNTQTFVTTAAAAVNATSVTVTSQSANFSYAIGSSVYGNSWSPAGGGGGAAGCVSTQVVAVGTVSTLNVTIGAGGSALGGGAASSGGNGTAGSSGTSTTVTGTGISVTGRYGIGGGAGTQAGVAGSAGIFGAPAVSAGNYGPDQGGYAQGGGAPNGMAAGGGGSGTFGTYTTGQGGNAGTPGTAIAGGNAGTGGAGSLNGGTGSAAGSNTAAGGGGGGAGWSGGAGGTGAAGGSGWVLIRVAG
jgi:parallel beta-helix repeat protein